VKSNGTKNRLAYSYKELEEDEHFATAANSSEVFWMARGQNCQVPVVWLRGSRDAADGSSPPLILLHCHANATDIGVMMGNYLELSRFLGVDVVGFEYTGYGDSQGALRTLNIFDDVVAAYDFVVGRGVPPSRIVVYGQSIGSAPACYLASFKPVGGPVLHSPIASGLQVIDPKPGQCCQPSCFLCCFDVFRNDWRIGRVKCPVLIMHGERDEVVPFCNATKLRDRCKKSENCRTYWNPTAGHNNFVESNRQAYFREMQSFFSSVRQRASEVGAPNIERPLQVSMPQLSSPLPDPSVVEMKQNQEVPTQKANYGPKIGPDDGRYRKLAQGGTIEQGAGTGIVAIGKPEE
jgi:pimeloyl-ACP methyl ester carboxylesterase